MRRVAVRNIVRLVPLLFFAFLLFVQSWDCFRLIGENLYHPENYDLMILVWLFGADFGGGMFLAKVYPAWPILLLVMLSVRWRPR